MPELSSGKSAARRRGLSGLINHRRVLMALLAVVGVGTALAATPTPPDPADILRQQSVSPARTPTNESLPRSDLGSDADLANTTPDRAASAAPRPAKSEPSPSSKAPLAASTRVKISGFRFSGLETVPEALLQDQVAEYIGQELTLQELHKVAARIERYLREREHLMVALAFVPAQAITDGVVGISVYEGELTELRYKINPASVRLRREAMRSLLKGSIVGGPIKNDQVELALSRLQQIPGVNARAVIIPENEPGKAKLAVEISEAAIFHGEIAVDNYGSRYTGDSRGSLDLQWNDPFGYGEQLRAKYTGSRYSHYGNLTASWPLLSLATRAGFGLTYSNYRLCCEFAPLNNLGHSAVAQFTLHHILARTRDSEWSLRFAAEHRRYGSEARDAATSKKRIGVVTLSVNGIQKNTWLTSGASQWSVSAYAGTNNLNALDSERQTDASGYRTAGTYRKWSANVSHSQWLTPSWSLLASASAQWGASKNLDSSEKFSLGGPAAVRAYPSGEVNGDAGLLASLETRIRLDDRFTAALFYDYGRARLWQKPLTGFINDSKLAGYGAYLDVTPLKDWLIRLLIASQIGESLTQRDSGVNSDGRSGKTQLWLYSNLSF